MDLTQIIKQCEDHLFPAKDFTAFERILYYHLLRHSRIEGREQIIVAMDPLAEALSISNASVREAIRNLDKRGCIKIENRSRKGHLVRVLLPEEIEGVISAAVPEAEINLETLDFYTGRRFVNALLAREQDKCFYCFKSIRPDSCQLDHVIPDVNGGDNSYRNIVTACHECNTTKLESAPADFVRSLYRKGTLSQAELTNRLESLEHLASGQLMPDVERVREALRKAK